MYRRNVMYRIRTNINSTSDTLEKFANAYEIGHRDLKEDLHTFVHNMMNAKSKVYEHIKNCLDACSGVINTDNKKFTRLNDVKIGDHVKITYMPYSQRYIDHYNDETITGVVIFIDHANDDMLLLSNDDGFVFSSMERLGCSYYGTTRGYDYTIWR